MLKSFLKRAGNVLWRNITLTGFHEVTPVERKAKADKWLKETKELLALRRNCEICEICEMQIMHPGIMTPSHKCEEHQLR